MTQTLEQRGQAFLELAAKGMKRTRKEDTLFTIAARNEAPGLVRELLAENARLTKAMWECPDCGFAFDAAHQDVGGGYSCPVCTETRLEAENMRLQGYIDTVDRVSFGKPSQ